MRTNYKISYGSCGVWRIRTIYVGGLYCVRVIGAIECTVLYYLFINPSLYSTVHCTILYGLQKSGYKTLLTCSKYYYILTLVTIEGRGKMWPQNLVWV